MLYSFIISKEKDGLLAGLCRVVGAKRMRWRQLERDGSKLLVNVEVEGGEVDKVKEAIRGVFLCERVYHKSI